MTRNQLLKLGYPTKGSKGLCCLHEPWDPSGGIAAQYSLLVDLSSWLTLTLSILFQMAQFLGWGRTD